MSSNLPDSAPFTRPAPSQAPAGLPTLAESLVVLGLLIAVAVSCWLLYGPLISRMFYTLIHWRP